MQDIKELTISELEDILGDWKYPKFHARQIFFWIYQKSIKEFAQMSDLPLDLRRKLKENFSLFSFKLVTKLKSEDKTEKFIFQLKDDNLIEAVTIPAGKRITGCISTQVGCKFSCSFCASGLLGFKRNLTSGEILEEILWLKNESSHKKLTHLVFMGTGEPLDNYDNVIRAIRLINSSEAFNIGARRITISTCGIIPGIKWLSKESLQIELSISLHAADDTVRSKIMPINKIYPLKDLLEVCREYIKRTDRQITFEYLLIKGINSDLPNAQKLGRILQGLRLCKVNLIPANPVAECKIGPPEKSEILQFRDYLLKQGLNITLRRARGEDIDAACGQLRLRYAEK